MIGAIGNRSRQHWNPELDFFCNVKPIEFAFDLLRDLGRMVSFIRQLFQMVLRIANSVALGGIEFSGRLIKITSTSDNHRIPCWVDYECG